MSGSPKPTSTLIASVAMAVPAWPTTGPSTPTFGEAGVVPGAGWTGCRLRSVSDGTGAGAWDQKTLTWKAMDTTVPHTSGTPESAQ